MLGITQAQYNKIIERWAEPEMMDVPAPFVYGADNTYFRAWTTSCLTDEKGVEELEKIVGPNVIPDFSAYTPSTPPMLWPDVPALTVWDILKNGPLGFWYVLTVKRSGVHGEIERYGIWCLIVCAIISLLVGVFV